MTSLWLRGGEAALKEALAPLGVAIERNRALPAHDKSFVGRLGTLKLDLSAAPADGLDTFRSHAAFKLRDERLGHDAKLGM
eukprot:2560638-Prymnesium_polylepis.1